MRIQPSIFLAIAGSLLAVAVAAAPWVIWPAAEASANHPHYTSSYLHLESQHADSSGQGAQDEDVCVDDIPGNTGDANIYNMVNDTFLLQSPHWDRMNGSDARVDLWPVSLSVGPCTVLDQTWVEVRVLVDEAESSLPSWCQYTGASCVDFKGPIPSVSPIHHRYGQMYMRGGHVPVSNANEYRRNINHEAGHVWGLKDPFPTNQYSGGCFASWGVGYYSVMHQYSAYCNTSGGYSVPYVIHPQGADFENVIAFQLPSH